jgi:hypothetical protein
MSLWKILDLLKLDDTHSGYLDDTQSGYHASLYIKEGGTRKKGRDCSAMNYGRAIKAGHPEHPYTLYPSKCPDTHHHTGKTPGEVGEG